VLNTLNTRLDAPLLAWQMNHCEAQVLITDREFAPGHGAGAGASCARARPQPVVIDVDDSEYTGAGERLGDARVRSPAGRARAAARLDGPADEWDAIAVSYTSGTTGDPKGVVTHHRGAYLNAVCNAATWTMPHFPKYLWTLPMFHCNGWCFPWTVAMLGGTHVCLRRSRPRPSWTRCASTAWTTTAPRPSCTTCSQRAGRAARRHHQRCAAWWPARRRRRR
jgi:fatty-acyl-CoA synthase